MFACYLFYYYGLFHGINRPYEARKSSERKELTRNRILSLYSAPNEIHLYYYLFECSMFQLKDLLFKMNTFFGFNNERMMNLIHFDFPILFLAWREKN